MKNNYPIKYALLPIEEQNGYTLMGDRKYEIVCYIVSKCYLVNEIKEYKQDGRVINKYEVVFAYDYDSYQGYKREEPSFNLVNYSCINSIYVDEIFDNFEDALKVKEEKNKKILLDSLMYLGQKKEKDEQIRKEFKSKTTYYNSLEKTIELKTDDLKVNNSVKRQATIIIKKGEIKETAFSLYETINDHSCESYIVYSILPEEYMRLKELSKSNKTNENFNYMPLLIRNKKSKIIKIISPNKEEKYLEDDCIKSSIDEVFQMPTEYEKIIYTIENYYDIIDSYKGNDIDHKYIKIYKK